MQYFEFTRLLRRVLLGLPSGKTLVFVTGLLTLPTLLPARTSEICLDAVQRVSNESGVPLSVLLAITQVETGRQRDNRIEPWPWTVNLEGEGFWFETRAQATEFAQSALAQGRTSFDTGCFQINYRWHSDRFGSLSDMFDPMSNARYAAQFLMSLYQEFGDWSLAAGAYHSRTPDKATAYRARFDRLRAQSESATENGEMVMAQSDSGNGAVSPSRVNRFPLLQVKSGAVALGSLVPLGDGS